MRIGIDILYPQKIYAITDIFLLIFFPAVRTEFLIVA